MHSIFPPDRLDAIERAIAAAFSPVPSSPSTSPSTGPSTGPSTSIAAAEPLHQGESGARIFRIVINGAPYLLRLIMRNPDVTLPDHIQCMTAAALADLAPPVIYTSIEDRLILTGFIRNAAPSLPLADARRLLPAALRRLHAIDDPKFPTRPAHLNTTCTYLLRRDLAGPNFTDRLRNSGTLPADFFDLLDRTLDAYGDTDPQDLVSSHNDLFKPDNILFDGQRLWLVDWEAAFTNDRYADLAAVANLLDLDSDGERQLLEQYFETNGQPPEPRQLRRLQILRAIADAFYAMAFHFMAARHPKLHPNHDATLAKARQHRDRFLSRK